MRLGEASPSPEKLRATIRKSTRGSGYGPSTCADAAMAAGIYFLKISAAFEHNNFSGPTSRIGKLMEVVDRSMVVQDPIAMAKVDMGKVMDVEKK